jgi:transposase
MLTISDSARVYLACGPTDMRKSIDGLAALVQHAFELDPFDASLFVFCNRERNKIKILYWDNNGFWLVYRRLEQGRFRWPNSSSEQTLSITRRQLSWLLDGLTIEQKQAHRPVCVFR